MGIELAAFVAWLGTAAGAMTMAAISVAMTVGSMIYQRDRARKLQNQARDEAEKQKGFQLVAEGQAAPINVFYGRNKVGGTRVFHFAGHYYNWQDIDHTLLTNGRADKFTSRGDYHVINLPSGASSNNRRTSVHIVELIAARSIEQQATDQPRTYTFHSESGDTQLPLPEQEFSITLQFSGQNIIEANVGSDSITFELNNISVVASGINPITGLYSLDTNNYRVYTLLDCLAVDSKMKLKHEVIYAEGENPDAITLHDYTITAVDTSKVNQNIVTITLRIAEQAVSDSGTKDNEGFSLPYPKYPNTGYIINSNFNEYGYANGSENDYNSFLYVQQVIGFGGINRVLHLEVDGKDWRDPSFNRNNLQGGLRAHLYYDGNALDDMLASSVMNSYSNANNGSPDPTTRMYAVFTDTAYASMVFRIHRDKPQFSGVPAVQFYLEGMRVRYITKSGDTYTLSQDKKYSNNPALCLMDYLLNPVYGKGLDESEIDLPSFYNAYTICERIVPAGNNYIRTKIGKLWNNYADFPGTGSDKNRYVKLYECNLGIDTSKSVRDNIEIILETMGQAELVWSGGKYKLQLEYPFVWGLNYSDIDGNGNKLLVVDAEVPNGTPTYYNGDVVQFTQTVNGKTVVDLYRCNVSSTTAEPLSSQGVYHSHWTRDVVSAYLNDDHIIREDVVTQTWSSAQSRLNYFTVRFLNESKDFAEDSVSWPAKTPGSTERKLYDKYLLEDNGIPMEGETFQTGDTTEWHAKATAEERVRTSRDAVVYKLTVDIKYTYLEPGDFVRIDSDVLKIPGELARVEEITVNDRGNAVIQLLKFDARMLAWNAKDDEDVIERNIYSHPELHFPTNLVWAPRTAEDSFITDSTSGVLSWVPAMDPRIKYFNVMLWKGPLAHAAADSPWELKGSTKGKPVHNSIELVDLAVGSYVAAVVPVDFDENPAPFYYPNTGIWPMIQIDVEYSFDPSDFSFGIQSDQGVIFIFESNIPTPDKITLNAVLKGAANHQVTYKWYKSTNLNTAYQEVFNTTATLIDDIVTTPWLDGVVTTNYKCVCSVLNFTFEDEITLSKLVSGSGAFVITQRNPSALVPCDALGTPSNYTSTGNVIEAYYGIHKLNAVSTLQALTSETFYVAVSGENIVPGTVVASGTTVSIGDSSGMDAEVDVAFVNYSVTVMVQLPMRVRDDPVEQLKARQTFNLEQSVAKVRIGAKGQTGDNSKIHYLTNLTPGVLFQDGLNYNPSSVEAEAYTTDGITTIAMNPCYIKMEKRNASGVVLDSIVSNTNKCVFPLGTYNRSNIAKDVVVYLRESSTGPLLDKEVIPFSAPNEPVLDLTNDNTSIYLSASDYALGNYAGANYGTANAYCSASVKRNGQLETGSWTISWTPSGCSIVHIDSDTIRISGMDGVNAAVTCSATDGRQTLTKVMSIVLQVQGESGLDGAPGVNRYMIVTPAILSVTNGTLSSSTITASGFKTENGITTQLPGSFSITPIGGGTGSSWSNVASVSFPVSYNKSITGYRVQYSAEGAEVDNEIVPVADPSVPIINLSNDSTVISETYDAITGAAVLSLSGPSASTTATVWKGSVNDSANWNFSWTAVGCSISGASGQSISITGLVSDTASATVVATPKPGNAGSSINAVFSIAKVKQGNKGNIGDAGSGTNLIYKKVQGTPPSTPPGAPGASSGVPTAEGWSDTPPAKSDGYTIYVSSGFKPVNGTTYTWTNPVQIQGTDAVGTLNEFTVYARAPENSPPTITGGSFDASTNTFLAPGGWNKGVPSGTDPCWASFAFLVVPPGSKAAFGITGWTTPIIAFKNGDPGTPGQTIVGPGSKGVVLDLYRWGSAAAPVGTSIYDWTSKSLNKGDVQYWDIAAPTNNTPGIILYKASKSISVADTYTGTTSFTWTDASIHATAANAAAGFQTADIKVYAVGTAGDSPPQRPSGAYTYTWASSTYTGSVGPNWSKDPGNLSIENLDKNQVVWQLTANISARNDETTTNFRLDDRGTVSIIGYGGKAGKSGISQITIELYTSTVTTTPPNPVTGGSYVFNTNSLTGQSLGSTSMPEPTVDAPYVWRTASTFRLDNTLPDTTPVTGDGWSSWKLVAQKAFNGANGTDGQSVRVVTLYQQASSRPNAPTGGSYDFSKTSVAEALVKPTPQLDWSYDAPSTTEIPTWCTEFTFRTTGATVAQGGTWSTPVLDAQKGSKGDTGPKGDTGDGTVPAYTIANSMTSVTPVPNPTTGTPLAVQPTGFSPNYPSRDLLPGEYVMMSMGRYVESENKTYWGKTFLAYMKVGELSAITANLGTISAGEMYGVSLTVGSTVTNDVFKIDTAGNHFAGSQSAADAPFRVWSSGQVKCSNIEITGDTSSISIAGKFFVDNAGSMWLGNSLYSAAPFKVSPSGELVCSNFSLASSTANFRINSLTGDLWIGAADWASAKFKVEGGSGTLHSEYAVITGGALSNVSLSNISSTNPHFTSIRVNGNDNQLGSAVFSYGIFNAPDINWGTFNNCTLNNGTAGNLTLNTPTINNPTITGLTVGSVGSSSGNSSCSVTINEAPNSTTVVIAVATVSRTTGDPYVTNHSVSIAGGGSSIFTSIVASTSSNYRGGGGGHSARFSVTTGGVKSYTCSVSNCLTGNISAIAVNIVG